MNAPCSTLSTIGHEAETQLRVQLDHLYPDERLMGRAEQQALLDELDHVWGLRVAHYILMRDHHDSLTAEEAAAAEHEAYRNGGRYRAIRAKLDAYDAARRRFYDLNPDKHRRCCQLDVMTAWRFPMRQIYAARDQIRKAVRGVDEVGPRWRVGSNNPWGPQDASLWSEEARCHHCGAPGGELRCLDGQMHCPTCQESWVVGDYDWLSLSDCLSYRDDREAGRVQKTLPNGWRGHFTMAVSHLVGMAA